MHFIDKFPIYESSSFFLSFLFYLEVVDKMRQAAITFYGFNLSF